MEWSGCTLATIGVPAIMFGRSVKHYCHRLPVRSGLNNQLLVQQVSSKLFFLISIIYIFIIITLIERVLGELMFIYY
jgi:hypothetical protein